MKHTETNYLDLILYNDSILRFNTYVCKTRSYNLLEKFVKDCFAFCRINNAYTISKALFEIRIRDPIITIKDLLVNCICEILYI